MDVSEDVAAPPPEALAAFFVAVIDTMLKFRFIPRDIDELVARDTRFAESFRSEIGAGDKRILAMFEALILTGLMASPRNPWDLHRICTNMQLQLLNWMRFLSTVRNQTEITENDIVEGALHAFLMIEPLLDRQCAGRVRSLLEGRKLMTGTR